MEKDNMPGMWQLLQCELLYVQTIRYFSSGKKVPVRVRSSAHIHPKNYTRYLVPIQQNIGDVQLEKKAQVSAVLGYTRRALLSRNNEKCAKQK